MAAAAIPNPRYTQVELPFGAKYVEVYDVIYAASAYVTGLRYDVITMKSKYGKDISAVKFFVGDDLLPFAPIYSVKTKLGKIFISRFDLEEKVTAALNHEWTTTRDMDKVAPLVGLLAAPRAPKN